MGELVGVFKVFCNDCKYYGIDVRCYHKNNITDSWFCPNDDFYDSPRTINRFNNCPWFEQKPIEPIQLEPPAKLSRKNLLRKIFGRK